MPFHWYQAETGPPLLGCGLLKHVALFQINKLTVKEAATCVPEFIEFLVSENCYAGLHVLFSCVERTQHFKQDKVVSIPTKESKSISGIKNSALPSVTSCHLVKAETASVLLFFTYLVRQNILSRSFLYSGN